MKFHFSPPRYFLFFDPSDVRIVLSGIDNSVANRNSLGQSILYTDGIETYCLLDLYGMAL